MKKALTRIMAVIALSSLLFVQMASATVESTDSGYTDDPSTAVPLEASINEAGTVDLSWTAYAGENFKYYKIVQSQDVVEPKYPEDSYISYTEDVNSLSYTTTVDEAPEGLNYYSLCVVLEGSIRGCTSISIEVPAREATTEEATPVEEEVAVDPYTDDETIVITLEGSLNDLGKAELSWTGYEGGDLKWYKVVHSQTNAEAVYPTDGYIAVYSDPTVTEYTHTDVPAGTNYYRVCVITDSDMRGCSNTVTLEKEVATAEPATFADTEGHWAQAYIEDLATKNVVEGTDGMFEPNKNVLRAEATKMVIIGLGFEETTCDATIFPDLNSGDWFCGVVTIAYKKGILTGDGGKLYPARNMTRAEAVKILLETKGITPPAVTENPFSDVNKDAWYAPYVYKASILGYVEGTNGMFEPNREITRAELAKIVSLASN
ncbi:S-layer homology domain-containing protein [Patescibacteria group bacterium]|nr:S-layer homology domain-containing protein [Patescibacteria group bacterium]